MESVCVGNGTAGSNPALSANPSAAIARGCSRARPWVRSPAMGPVRTGSGRERSSPKGKRSCAGPGPTAALGRTAGRASGAAPRSAARQPCARWPPARCGHVLPRPGPQVPPAHLRRGRRPGGRHARRCRARSARTASATPTCSAGRAGPARPPPRASWPRRSTASAAPTPTPCGECERCRAIDAGTRRRRDRDRRRLAHRASTTCASCASRRPTRRCARASRSTSSTRSTCCSKDAFNALLKTLEEPPPHVKFLFATTEPQKVPDTMRSRCQVAAARADPRGGHRLASERRLRARRASRAERGRDRGARATRARRACATRSRSPTSCWRWSATSPSAGGRAARRRRRRRRAGRAPAGRVEAGDRAGAARGPGPRTRAASASWSRPCSSTLRGALVGALCPRESALHEADRGRARAPRGARAGRLGVERLEVWLEELLARARAHGRSSPSHAARLMLEVRAARAGPAPRRRVPPGGARRRSRARARASEARVLRRAPRSARGARSARAGSEPSPAPCGRRRGRAAGPGARPARAGSSRARPAEPAVAAAGARRSARDRLSRLEPASRAAARTRTARRDRRGAEVHAPCERASRAPEAEVRSRGPEAARRHPFTQSRRRPVQRPGSRSPEMTGSFGEMGSLLKQAQKMQRELDRVREELRQTHLRGQRRRRRRARRRSAATARCTGVEISDEVLASGDKGHARGPDPARAAARRRREGRQARRARSDRQGHRRREPARASSSRGARRGLPRAPRAPDRGLRALPRHRPAHAPSGWPSTSCATRARASSRARSSAPCARRAAAASAPTSTEADPCAVCARRRARRAHDLRRRGAARRRGARARRASTAAATTC